MLYIAVFFEDNAFPEPIMFDTQADMEEYVSEHYDAYGLIVNPVTRSAAFVREHESARVSSLSTWETNAKSWPSVTNHRRR